MGEGVRSRVFVVIVASLMFVIVSIVADVFMLNFPKSGFRV